MLWTQKKDMDAKTREQLGVASRDFAACLKQDFWGDFMAGKNVNIEFVCLAQKAAVSNLQQQLGHSDRI